VPIPTFGERNVRTGTADIASDPKAPRAFDGRKALAEHSLLKSVRQASQRTRGVSTPGYSTFRAVFCEHHESGSSMRRVSASVVRVVPAAMDKATRFLSDHRLINRPYGFRPQDALERHERAGWRQGSLQDGMVRLSWLAITHLPWLVRTQGFIRTI
jgi:hypothetical protein